MSSTTLAARIAAAAVALRNCEHYHNPEWQPIWCRVLHKLAAEYLPHGSGFDSGCRIDDSRTDGARITITADYHSMDEFGAYDGWYSYTATARASFVGLVVTVRGPDRGIGLRDHVADCLAHALESEVPDEAWQRIIEAARAVAS